MAKIMIVDDSGLSRRILRSILEPDGHEVVEESDGMAALERFYLEKPDIIILDMTMPGMPGMDVLARLRELDKNVRVIIGTADIQSSTQDLTKAAGASAFVGKPFTPERLLPVIHELLEAKLS